MLFKEQLNEIRNQIDANTSEIDELLVTVENLQADNQKYQEYLQQLEVANDLSEKALEQLRKAFVILHKIDPTLMQALKAEIDRLFVQVQNGEIESINLANLNRVSSAHVVHASHDRISDKKKKMRTNKSTPTKKLVAPETEAKKVKVEVLESEQSQYEAVMKIKQLL